jgi:hypothetical protein
MTVKELIELLQKEDGDRIVVVHKRDSEYSPLCDVKTGAYAAEEAWVGEGGLEELTKAHKADGYTKEDVVDGVKALFLASII